MLAKVIITTYHTLCSDFPKKRKKPKKQKARADDGPPDDEAEEAEEDVEAEFSDDPDVPYVLHECLFCISFALKK